METVEQERQFEPYEVKATHAQVMGLLATRNWVEKELVRALDYIEEIEIGASDNINKYHEERRKNRDLQSQLESQIKAMKQVQSQLELKESDNETLLKKVKEYEDRETNSTNYPDSKQKKIKKLKVAAGVILPERIKK
jgi:hypothetical protein